jgi:hypothetical protein
VWLALVGAGFFAWLALDLAEAAIGSPWAVVARAACGAFWWSLAAVVLSRRWHRLGLVSAAVCVGVLLAGLGLGLLLTPAEFVTGSFPSSTDQARLLGAAVLALSAIGALWWLRRPAGGRGEGVEDGLDGR